MAERLNIAEFNIDQLTQQGIVLDPHGEKPTINTVFNINPNGMLPAGFLKGFLPGFKMAQLIAEQTNGKVVPEVRVFEPTRFTTFVNQIDPEKAAAQISLGNAVIDAMAKKHFPAIDFHFGVDQPITTEGLQILAKVNELIPGEHTDVLNSLRNTGIKYGGLSGQALAVLYPAHHPFGWLNIEHPTIFADTPKGQVINLLPPSERRFTTIRQATLAEVKSSELAKLLSPKDTAEFELEISGAHYISVKNEIGTFIEPSLARVLNQSCRETSEEYSLLINQHKKGVRSNLKSASRDFQLMIACLADTQTPEEEEQTLRTIIGL